MKHIFKFYLLITFSFTFISSGYTKPGVKTVFNKAEDAYYKDNLQVAAKLYHQVLVSDPNHFKANARLGDIYLELKQPDKAVVHLKKATEHQTRYSKELQIQLAEAYQLNYDFDKAISQYFDLQNRVKRDARASAKYHKRLKECVAGKQLLYRQTPVKLQNMGAPINSASSDHVPVLTNNDSTLIFTSRRPKGDKKIDLYSDEDVFFINRSGADWSVPVRFGKTVNTADHDAVLAVSPDGGKMYLYKSNENGSIYETRKGAHNTWQVPVKMGQPLNSKFYEPSVFFSKDGNYAFFASDRPGGFGGLDLYLSVAEADGNWGEAINLGPSINTAYDEDAPFLNAENTILYFSSKGHNSMGGYDVFQSTINSATWSMAHNMGSPVNSPADDIFYVQTRDGHNAFFASDRPGGFGGSDIYLVQVDDVKLIANNMQATGAFTAMFPSENGPDLILSDFMRTTEEPAGINILNLKSWIKDGQTGDTLEAQVTLLNLDFIQEEETAFVSKRSPMQFTLDKNKTYGLLVQKEGYILSSQPLVLPETKEADQLEIPLIIKKATGVAAVTLQNISFYADQDMLKSQSLAELEWLFQYLESNEEVSITITGFINPEDSLLDKKTLNAKRMQSITKYLISKGIEGDRVKLKEKRETVQATKGESGLIFLAHHTH